MAKDKAQRAARGGGRDGGGFVALPWSVLDCPAYCLLSHPARSLLVAFARQYVLDNNGRLLASGKYLSKRGWRSADVIQRAKRELLDAGFIYETVKGHRPNKASWYAITWQNLDKHPDYDAGIYEGWKEARSGYAHSTSLKIKRLIPSKGISDGLIAPCGGVMTSPTIPSGGTIRGPFDQQPTPPNGNHLEIPSAV
ncbi:hypothetical protein G6720_06040 [Polynucleobacter paneuropaeus]|nr:hypothetical protein G6720_06040 [Polynucleobacter paneuropaeus]